MAMSGNISFCAQEVTSTEWQDSGNEYEQMEIKIKDGQYNDIVITISRIKKKPEVIRLIPGEDPF